MEYSLEEKYNLIMQGIKGEISKNPIQIVKKIMHQPFINLHGPEHHFLDGAAFLVAYKNARSNVWFMGNLRFYDFYRSCFIHNS